MSNVVSFRCSDELEEFLEQEAERRMTTKSTAAQMLLAEKVRELRSDDDDNGASEGVNAGNEEQTGGPLDRPPFTDHPRAWYEPNTNDPDEIVAVRIPEDVGGVEDRRYYKTYDGAAAAIRRWYEGEDVDGRGAR